MTVAKGIAYVLRNPAVPDHERNDFLVQLQTSLDKLMGDRRRDHHDRRTRARHVRVEPDPDRPRPAACATRSTRTKLAYPEIHIDDSVADSLYAIADGARIGGVVRELLDNACRYSPRRASRGTHRPSLDEGVVITITDHGEGLDRAVAAQSFDEPFSTGEATLRKEKAGVGVGLHLARQMVVEHGGILWADPLPGGGTRAAFCIPSQAGQRLASPPARRRLSPISPTRLVPVRPSPWRNMASALAGYPRSGSRMRKNLCGAAIALLGAGCSAPSLVDAALVAASPSRSKPPPPRITQSRPDRCSAMVPDGWQTQCRRPT